MRVTPVAGSLETTADASMDDILASIRSIIAEEPLSYRHRLPAKAAGRNRTPQANPEAVVATPSAREPSPIGVPAVFLPPDPSEVDPVLAELLAGDPPIRDQAASASTPPAAAPSTSVDANPHDVETIAVDPASHARSIGAAAPLVVERRSAASVLDALAAGLAVAERHPSGATVKMTAQERAMPAESVAATCQTEPARPRADESGCVEDGGSDASVVDYDPVMPLAVTPPPSFEETIAGMLRPLLREWLDAHMPRLVDKALREELRDNAHRGLPADVAGDLASR